LVNPSLLGKEGRNFPQKEWEVLPHLLGTLILGQPPLGNNGLPKERPKRSERKELRKKGFANNNPPPKKGLTQEGNERP